MARFDAIFIILTFEFISTIKNQDIGHHIVPHCDLFHILPNYTTLSYTLLTSGHQIAANFGGQHFGLNLSEVRTPLLIKVHSGVNTSEINMNYSARSRDIITWVYQSEKHIPKQRIVHLNDRVYYYEDGMKLYEVYGIKDQSFHQEITGSLESRLKRRMNFHGVAIQAVDVVK